MSEAPESNVKREADFLESILSENVRLGGFNLVTLPVVLLVLRSEDPDEFQRWVAVVYAFFFAISSVAYGVIVVQLMKKQRNHSFYHAYSREWSEFSGKSLPTFDKIHSLWRGVFYVKGSSGHEIKDLLPSLKIWRDLAFFPQIGMIIAFAILILLSLVS